MSQLFREFTLSGDVTPAPDSTCGNTPDSQGFGVHLEGSTIEQLHRIAGLDRRVRMSLRPALLVTFRVLQTRESA
jgi:hypothetical protein